MRPMILLVALALCLPASGLAQEVKPQRSSADFHWLVLVKFYQGKEDRADEIAEQYLDPIDKEIGTQVVSIHVDTGEWDRITMFKMAGGPADIGWRVTPSDAKFMNALARKVGSMAAAEKILAEFDSLVARREVHLAHTHP